MSHCPYSQGVKKIAERNGGEGRGGGEEGGEKPSYLKNRKERLAQQEFLGKECAVKLCKGQREGDIL